MADAPRISVVFATHERAGRLERLLASLREQSLGTAAFEVIVVDDASGDDTPAVLAREEARGELDLTTMRLEGNAGPAVARDRGWRAARAAYVAFTDDDCRTDARWLEEGLAALEAHPGSFVQGRTIPDPDERSQAGPFSRTLDVDHLGPFFQTCNVMYPRAVLERVDGFDCERFARSGEDADLAWRAKAAGSEPVFAPAALVMHAVSDLGPKGKLRVAWRWHETMRLFALYPELARQELTYGVFWKGSHYLLARALLAAVLPRRWAPVRAWLARPYVLYLLQRGRHEGGGPLMAPYYLVHDLVEMAAALRGGLRAGRPLL